MSEAVKTDKLVVSASPYITRKRTTRGIMLDVCIALVPALAAAVYFFGITALIMAAICIAVCVLSELLFTLARKSNTFFKKETVAAAEGGQPDTKKKHKIVFLKDVFKDAARGSSIKDCSAIVTGLLLALNLPVMLKDGGKLSGIFDLSGIHWGNTFLLCIVGSVFAIVIVKMLFGGIGKNFANPAMTARIFLIIAFATVMKKVTPNLVLTGDSVTAATWLTPNAEGLRSTEGLNLLDMFFGVKNSAAVGEVSVLALLIGGIYLCVRKVINFRLPLVIIGSVALFSFVFNKFDYKYILPNILSGGLFLGAIFMATDYSSSPNTKWGSMLYGFLMGFLIVIIRQYSTYPEGVSFAIVLMNILTPLIDKYIVPVPFGKKRGKKEKLKNPKAVKEAA